MSCHGQEDQVNLYIRLVIYLCINYVFDHVQVYNMLLGTYVYLLSFFVFNFFQCLKLYIIK